MPQFIVPESLSPGVLRADLGLIRPGKRFKYPDHVTERIKAAGKKEKISRQLIPTDQAGYRLLCKMWPKHKDEIAKPQAELSPAAPEAPPTQRELVDAMQNEDDLTGAEAVAAIEEQSAEREADK